MVSQGSGRSLVTDGLAGHVNRQGHERGRDLLDLYQLQPSIKDGLQNTSR